MERLIKHLNYIIIVKDLKRKIFHYNRFLARKHEFNKQLSSTVTIISSDLIHLYYCTVYYVFCLQNDIV